MVSDDVQTVVRDVITEQLDGVRIVRVYTKRDQETEGDGFLRVTVVVDSPASAFNVKRLSGLVRHLRPKLAEHKERAFPLISFMSKADAKALAL